jgi:1-deoxy-D-xylulose-5-phosphate reductoisomerase
VDYPQRQYAPRKRLDLPALPKLTFFAPDEETFPAMKLCREVMERGGNLGAAVNGANEVAVAAFLAGKIPFAKIYPIVEQAARSVSFLQNPTLEDIFETDRQVRAAATLML